MQQSHSLKPWTVEAEGSLTLVSVLCFLKGPVPSLMPFGYCWAPGRNVIRAEQMKHQDSGCGISTELRVLPGLGPHHTPCCATLELSHRLL